MESNLSLRQGNSLKKIQFNLPKPTLNETHSKILKQKALQRVSLSTIEPSKLAMRRNTSFCCLSQNNEKEMQQVLNLNSNSSQLIECMKQSIDNLKKEAKNYTDTQEKIRSFKASICKSKESLYLPDTLESDTNIKGSFVAKNNEFSETISAFKQFVEKLVKKVDNSEIKIQESKKVNEQLQEEVQELKKKIEEHRLLTEEANDHKCSVKCTIM